MVDSVSDLMQQAMAHHRRGELEEAARFYKRALAREPGHADALHLTGVIAHQQGRNEDAVDLIGRAIAKSPGEAAFRNNLGMALMALGRATQAEDAYQEALGLAPDFADALLNLGNLRAGQGLLEEAVTLLERAVAVDADSPEAHYNLGSARFALGDFQAALDALGRAALLGADFAEAHYKLGAACAALGKIPEAITSYAKALDRDGDHPGAQHGLLECLDTLPMGVDAVLLEALLAPLLRGKCVNPRALGHAAARLLARKYALDAGEQSPSSPQALCDRILQDDVARLYLQRTINVSAALERLLTQCRGFWLNAAAGELHGIAQSRWNAVGAVAIQCFLNEYVWVVTAEEERSVVILEQRIVAACASEVSPNEALGSDLLVYACYRPLWRIACTAKLGATVAEAWPPPIGELLRVCLHEPLRERSLGERLSSAAAIRDSVSRAVRAQYEENPYPRWLAITRSEVQSIESRVQRWCPSYCAPAAFGGALRVLVAGCGTGMDAIDTALHLQNAEVSAIDLSRASLAFAMRKAEEYGLANVRFRHQDILELDDRDGSYHYIHCTGVLHHMQDPAAGLERLVQRLIPGGLMKLAFYSRVARGPLLEAREVIRASGFGPRESGIRALRQQVLEEGAASPMAELGGSTDFFSLSECRDFLFHVHEVELSLPEIQSMLDRAGLEFLGFELAISEVEQGFRREYPDAALTDLQAWTEYEQRHPESFRAMYQFWCQKPL